MTPELVALALVVAGQVAAPPGSPPAGAPSNFQAVNLGGMSDQSLIISAKHYKNGQESAASGSVNVGYTTGNIKLRCTWTNGDSSAYTRIYDSNGVLQITALPGATTIDIREIKT